MKIIKFIALWVAAPVVVLRHIVKGVSHYEIRSDKMPIITNSSWFVAKPVFNAILDLNMYGEWVSLVEVYSDGTEEEISFLKW